MHRFLSCVYFLFTIFLACGCWLAYYIGKARLNVSCGTPLLPIRLQRMTKDTTPPLLGYDFGPSFGSNSLGAPRKRGELKFSLLTSPQDTHWLKYVARSIGIFPTSHPTRQLPPLENGWANASVPLQTKKRSRAVLCVRAWCMYQAITFTPFPRRTDTKQRPEKRGKTQNCTNTNNNNLRP